MENLSRINLNFFGYGFSVSSNNTFILEQIKYIYKHYIMQTEPESIDIDYYFRIVSNKGIPYFLSELLEEDTIAVTHGSNPDAMKKWESSTTFLPPITAPYFEKKFSFFHGCALRYSNETIMIVGRSRTGKTTLAMNYLSKTIQEAIRRKPNNIPTFFVKELNLTTELIHAEEVDGWKYYEHPSKIDKVYFLDGSVNAEMSGREFMMKMLAMNYQSYNPIQIISKIYLDLTSKPERIPIHHREIL